MNEDATLRLECLKLAVSMPHQSAPEDAVKAAQKLYDFVTGKQ